MNASAARVAVLGASGTIGFVVSQSLLELGHDVLAISRGRTEANAARLERLATVDRSILRLAIYELRSGTAPAKVVIDEALELAKKFSSAEAPAFLNGILGAALTKIEG